MLAIADCGFEEHEGNRGGTGDNQTGGVTRTAHNLAKFSIQERVELAAFEHSTPDIIYQSAKRE